ncbi:hypothetical protein WJX84_000003 [Apatococcus fuscideae]|uniref:Uncharacterized protein n=1 Tax=Apatococcus fuscideae TaxID=2026836 RepID=A0AAW1RNX9_9CHLO
MWITSPGPLVDVARIDEWLTEKVDGFSDKIKPDAKEVEEEGQKGGLGDIDLFTLTQDKDRLTVNNKWLQHLQKRFFGEDGQPRTVQETKGPQCMGLVLEWVYGAIVSTAGRAREVAHRSLGQNSIRKRDAGFGPGGAEAT